MVGLIIGIIVGWNIIGCVICIGWGCQQNADGLELCNPYWSYKYHKKVNMFGAIMLSLLYTTLCPFAALCYWFYKLCTVGRR